MRDRILKGQAYHAISENNQYEPSDQVPPHSSEISDNVEKSSDKAYPPPQTSAIKKVSWYQIVMPGTLTGKPHKGRIRIKKIPTAAIRGDMVRFLLIVKIL